MSRPPPASSPASSVYKLSVYSHHTSDNVEVPVQPTPSPSQPSIFTLFSFLSRRHFLLIALPAIVASIIAGGVAPYMTAVVGHSFDAFSQYPLSNPSPADTSRLLHGVGSAALQLLALAAAALVLSSITSALWIWTGEHNVRAVRIYVYNAVTSKNMYWFDSQLISEKQNQDGDRDASNMGAGGLMASFARDTENLRLASSLATGRIIQHLTTCLTCLILAFIRSWALTLVILSAVPVLILIQSLSQSLGGPLLAAERAELAEAASALERILVAIPTVKAHNAQSQALHGLSVPLRRLRPIVQRLVSLWSVAAGLGQFVTMAMFVQGFWFGARLVRSGTLRPGDVMAVFWACLIATSNLQMCIPHAVVLAKGLAGFSALLALTDVSPDSSQQKQSQEPFAARNIKNKSKPLPLRGIRSQTCNGEFTLHNVTFSYPSRPNTAVLSSLSLFLPARETTFVVGGSGSGKSTLARLLIKMYAPQSGEVLLDNVDCAYAEQKWVSENVLCVGGDCVVIDGTVHENVALGSDGVGKEEVVEACRAALMHEFVTDLPDGYDTCLGNGGIVLSGGQRQRLSIARARLRNPTVLILDEATSALDVTSRVLVFEAIKRWRANKTTIVITHDLSQITPTDFVYVLGGGRVVEQGYRGDLQASGRGVFPQMVKAQAGTGGYLPEKMLEPEVRRNEVISLVKESDRPGRARPVTWGNLLVESVLDLPDIASKIDMPPPQVVEPIIPLLMTASMVKTPPRARVGPSSRVESRAFSFYTPSMIQSWTALPTITDDWDVDSERYALQRSGSEASRRRPVGVSRTRTQVPAIPSTKVDIRVGVEEVSQSQSLWALLKEVYPTVPCKAFLFLGLAICVLNGAMTPLFSFLLSRLIFAVSTGGILGSGGAHAVNVAGALVLEVAALDGVLLGAKHVVMEYAAMRWIEQLRSMCFARVVAQDQRWFDRKENNVAGTVQALIKDGDDAGTLISVVLGQLSVVFAMLGVGMVWALAKGWQLALVGFAIAPVFAVAMTFLAGVVSKCELRTKRAAEEVAKSYYETLSNIQSIRYMALEDAFRARFDKAAQCAHSMGVQGSFVEGCTQGVGSALVYVAEAMLFYVGAVLVARRTYSYLQMVEVLNLVVFTVTIGSQLLTCTQKIAKATQATRDLLRLTKLALDTDESKGTQCPPPTGAITFKNVTFAYPEGSDTPVLKDLSMRIAAGECVAIVGSSGSGKSTIAALMQRLYEPDNGSIMIGAMDLRSTDVRKLREHVAVVSQQTHLFDGSVGDNIAFGSSTGMSEEEVRRAARAVGADEFVNKLPKGYATPLGEKGRLLSAGQAQRVQIARALARRSARVFVMDECTSALDGECERVVLGSVIRGGWWLGPRPTRIMVTHKLSIMRACDRVLVIDGGRVVENGKYEALMKQKGLFWSLANAGEWQGDSQ